MIDFSTVLPSLLSELTDSKGIFGFLYSILLGAPYVFNVVFGHVLASRGYRWKFLLSGIYLRSLAFLGMAAFTFWFAVEAPTLVVGSFFGWIALFSLSGGFAGLAQSDIIGKLVLKGERGRLYATKQFASGLASLLGGLTVARIFNTASLGFPRNFALSFLIGFVGLLIGAVAFWFIREPPSPPRARQETLAALLRRVPALLRRDAEFRRFIVVENLSSFSLMILPFYMVFAKETFAIGGGLCRPVSGGANGGRAPVQRPLGNDFWPLGLPGGGAGLCASRGTPAHGGACAARAGRVPPRIPPGRDGVLRQAGGV